MIDKWQSYIRLLNIEKIRIKEAGSGKNMEDISQVKKEIFMSMKIIDTTINGIKESEEYKIAQAYNQGLRDAMTIFEKKLK